MSDCVFCKIGSGKEEAHVVYKDEDFMAFLDSSPRTKGHTLVIPRKHYRWVDEVENFSDYFEVVRKVSEAAKHVLKPEWMQFYTIGEAVYHAHVQVFPRYSSDAHGALPNLSHIEKLSYEEMDSIARGMRERIEGGGVGL